MIKRVLRSSLCVFEWSGTKITELFPGSCIQLILERNFPKQTFSGIFVRIGYFDIFVLFVESSEAQHFYVKNISVLLLTDNFRHILGSL